MGLGEIGSRVRSLYDVNAFCLRVLRPQNGPLVGVSAVGVVGGLIYLGVDIRSGAWIAVVVGAFGAVDTVFSLAQRFMSPRKKLEPDDRTDSLLSQLTVRDDYADSGYAVTFLPGESVQAVVRSPNVDASLRDPRTDFPLRVNEEFVFGNRAGQEEEYFGSGWNGLLVVQDLEEGTASLSEQTQQEVKILQVSELGNQLETILEQLLAGTATG